MKDCWSHYPQKRPSFNILRHRMIAILDEPGDDIYVEQMCDNAYDIVEDLPGEKCWNDPQNVYNKILTGLLQQWIIKC